MDILNKLLNEYETLKGQFVICNNIVYRFIGIVKDDCDYYYCLYDGNKVYYMTCVAADTILPLKGNILDKYYESFVETAKYNSLEQPTHFLYRRVNKEDVDKYIELKKQEIINSITDTIVYGLCFDIN